MTADAIGVKLQAHTAGPVSPAAALPSLRLLRAIVPPNRLVLSLEQGAERVSYDATVEAAALSDPPADELFEFVEDLAAIQDGLHTAFPLPEQFSSQGAATAQRLHTLLDGGLVAWQRGLLDVELDPERVAEFRSDTENARAGQIRVVHDGAVFTIAGYRLHVGPLVMFGEYELKPDAIVVAAGVDATASAPFDIVGDGFLHARLATDDDGDLFGAGAPAGSPRVAIAPFATRPDVDA